MKISSRVSVATATIGIALAAGSASSAAYNFSDCPRDNPAVLSCVDVVPNSGNMVIKGFNVPLGRSLEIRGGIAADSTGTKLVLVPPRGTTGVFGTPVPVPGGLLGIDLPIPGNMVTATAELAGSPSAVEFDLGALGIKIPLKLKLSNPLIGSNCHIGSNASPVNLNMITGTTSPPAPNRPITGRVGTFTDFGTYGAFVGNVNVDNSFSIPGATGCGIGLGLIDLAINAKLKLPSASGNNSITIANDIGLKAPGF